MSNLAWWMSGLFESTSFCLICMWARWHDGMLAVAAMGAVAVAMFLIILLIILSKSY
jgi:hypothetical protein